ncbi:hypothetical protein [Streptomyces sp. MB09-02B]|nr:hypothetical protein [Streptomyces sp. MB09-02B]MDX3637910.1 hypothetical protein [Streptomyces sp. MB09-02B]
MREAPARGARTNRHLARVATLAVAVLVGTQWLASAVGIGAR